MNENPQKRYREIREDCRTVAVIRFFIFLPKERMCYMPDNRPNRPTPTYPNIEDLFKPNRRVPQSEIDPKENRIRALEREVAELRRYKEAQEEKENPRVKKYRKKPVEIEAIRYTTIGALKKAFPDIVLCIGFLKRGGIYIQTLEGRMEVSEWDYIIKGIKGEYYPCKPDIFEDTYERA